MLAYQLIVSFFERLYVVFGKYQNFYMPLLVSIQEFLSSYFVDDFNLGKVK